MYKMRLTSEQKRSPISYSITHKNKNSTSVAGWNESECLYSVYWGINKLLACMTDILSVQVNDFVVQIIYCTGVLSYSSKPGFFVLY